MILYGILGTFLFVSLIVLFAPVRVYFESKPFCVIQWLFIKIRIRLAEGTVQSDLKLFNRKTRLLSSDKPKKKKPEKQSPASEKKKSKKKKKKLKKITFDLVLEILKDKAVSKSLNCARRFVVRVLKSGKFTFLKWNIGFKDYYWQGILTGLVAAVPKSEHLEINSNFQEVNDLVFNLKIYIWKLFLAVFLLLFSFPYLKVLRLYRRLLL